MLTVHNILSSCLYEYQGAPRVGPPPSAGIPKTPPLEEATPVLENLPTHEALQTEQTDATAGRLITTKHLSVII